MGEVTHGDILRELGALGERLKGLSDDVEDGFERSEAADDRATGERHEIFRRLRLIENAREIETGIDAGVAARADRWRGRLYAVVRHLAPPGLAATLVAWWMENHS